MTHFTNWCFRGMWSIRNKLGILQNHTVSLFEFHDNDSESEIPCHHKKVITCSVMSWSSLSSQVSRKGDMQCSRVWRRALSGNSSWRETTLSCGWLLRSHHFQTAEWDQRRLWSPTADCCGTDKVVVACNDNESVTNRQV